MSSVYATEPASSGRVLFETTHGPLEIQLWCRECPLITKLFLQLCIDGFYENMIFHRIVADFLIQTGALRHGKKPAGFTKDYQIKVQAPLVLERRKYETHSRLRFNHRGQLAMALGVNDDDDVDDDNNKLLQPQFFITLDEAPYLDGKHVLFGTCSGPTIFNALRIGNIAVDENCVPKDLEHAPRITACKIIENPIHTSVAPMAFVPWRMQESAHIEKKKKTRKGKKDLKLLSFGDEMEVDEVAGMKSCHDVSSSKTLSELVDQKVEELATNGGHLPRVAKIEEQRDSSAQDHNVPEDEASAAVERSELNTTHIVRDTPIETYLPQSPKDTFQKPRISLVEARLARFRGKVATSKRSREDATMSKLVAFQSKVMKQAAARKCQGLIGIEPDNSLASRMARKAQTTTNHSPEDEVETYHGQVLEDDVDDEGNAWMGTRFKCRRHIDHASRLGTDERGGDGRHMNDYDVIDEKYKKSERRDGKRQRLEGNRQH